ncbi:N-acetylmuramoyl-L-alanine amidase-like domain-containing protein [Flammeovirga pacifica]|uniref:Xylanase n=1 Tax=Flammeovirga pacifica TaxID=915059 RepID=A0A1S1YVV5_FLAPC|nr:N-acetylmuramoyl-L-alanine amidase-like domain-containing protein [Flammeovirga pacifica]OHX65178.1 hypothetical protein NH26_01830 [Flammeovirga pacifica]
MSKQFFVTFCLLFITFYGKCQVTCSLPNKKAFETKIDSLNKIDLDSLNPSQKITSIAETFLGEPYMEKTLDIDIKKETVVINFTGFDCTTFVENMIALTKLYTGDQNEKYRTLEHYASILEHIRYRNGKLKGYTSRLHYFTDWVRNNQAKGIVKDITVEIGGQTYDKNIDFMSTHITAYDQLVKNDSAISAIRLIEDDLNQTPLSQIYIKDISKVESKIQSGDIIALVCNVKGLDVAHVGLALRKEDGRIYLLHASQSKGKVVITDKPLAEWLKNSKLNTGITVARLN